MSKWVHSTHSPAWSISAQAVAVETSSRLTTPTSPVEAQGESSTNSPMAAMATCSVSSGSESEMSVSDCAANVEELADSEALTPAGKGKGKGPTKGKGPAKGKGKGKSPQVPPLVEVPQVPEATATPPSATWKSLDGWRLVQCLNSGDWKSISCRSRHVSCSSLGRLKDEADDIYI